MHEIPSFRNFLKLKLQSEEVSDEGVGGAKTSLATDDVMKSQTLSFMDNNAGTSYNIPTSENVVALVDSTEDLSLGKFLARPTLINSYTWTTAQSQGPAQTIQPWYLFLNSAAIKKKIDNFAFIRGKLHIKIILNGTPFIYGLMNVSYNPLLGRMASKINLKSGSGNLATMIPLSQMPHIYLQPQESAGGDMELPFLYNRNWLPLTAFDTQNFGSLIYFIFDGLDTAISSTTTNVTIRTYAWMSDVELMGSTATLALQSQEQNDEYGNGPISAPATALASTASMLSTVPVIGKFARATEIGASAVSSIAQMFGFTNVPTIDNVCAYQPANAPHLSSAHIGTSVQKLTLDPKQELSIDPSIHGLGSADELSIAHFKKRESLYGSFLWSTSDTIGKLLFTARVSPSLLYVEDVLNTSSAVVGKQLSMTPVAYLSTIFQNWRGDLVFRFKFVTTKYHKGRLKIVYDPFSANSSTIEPAENTVYTHIMDIGEKDDFDMVIPYHQPTAWCNSDDSSNANWGTTAGSATHQATVSNGTISIYVHTALTAPTSSNVNTFAFIRGGDTLEYANPEGSIQVGGKTPSFFPLQSEEKTDLLPDAIVMGAPTALSADRYHMNFGENVASLRTLLRRYCLQDRAIFTQQTNLVNYSYGELVKEFKRMPYIPGYYPTGTYNGLSQGDKSITTGAATYSYTWMHPLPYISSCFVGYRGSVNFTVTPSLQDQSDAISIQRMTRNSIAPNRVLGLATLSAGASTMSQNSKLVNNNGLYQTNGNGGTAMTSIRTNGSIQFALPDLNLFNFAFADYNNYYNGFFADGTDNNTACMIMPLMADPSVNSIPWNGVMLTTHAAAGTDFTCLFFLCIPTITVVNVNVPSFN